MLQRRCKRINKKIEGDILYIDPPYNSRQYLPNYHLLETIARYDEPKINGKTGIRDYTEEKSNYCVKAKVYEELENLISNANFKHIIMSYNQEGILKKEEIEKILKKYGRADTYKLYQVPYKQYENKLTKKMEQHYEYIFYIKKEKQNDIYIKIPFLKSVSMTLMEDQEQYVYTNENYQLDSHKKYIKSPLNYVGGKYKLLPQLMKYFPTNINTFVDLFSGGFNVGINVKSNQTICNDINYFIIDLYKELYNRPVDNVLKKIYENIERYCLSKENENAYKNFRIHYNETKNPIDLYTLTCYSFNYQFRFNNNQEYNNPFGRNRLPDALKANPLKIKYIDLVGKSSKPRPIARCNGIIQATVNGQRRPFIGNWPADNFIRWAQCLGFIKYNYYDDTFEITETGLEFSNSQEGKQRDETRNPNKLWNNFSSNIDEFYFTFISGEFRGNIDEKLNRISIVTNRKGVAITIISLLKLVNEIKAQRMDLNSVKNIFKNKVY